MGGFQVQVLGVGDTFSEVHHPSALVLACQGHHLAVDCPDMYRRVLRDFRGASGTDLQLADIDDFLITHLHGDHLNGLEGVAYFNHFALGRRTRVHASPEVTAVLWDERLAASMGQLWDGQTHQAMRADDYFELNSLDWTAIHPIGPFSVQLQRTRHHVPTSALLVEAGGRKLGYSCDTAFDPALIDFLAPADLIIHETNLGPAHTPLEALLALPQDLRARLRLIHYPDAFDPQACPIPALRAGQVIEV